MKVLFVVPRFHTNQVEWIRILKENQHHPEIYAQFKGYTENYSDINPKVIKPSLLTRIRLFLINLSSEEDNVKSIKRMVVFSPSILDLFFKLLEDKPDVVILRDRTKLSAITHLLCCILGIENVLYNQTPYYSKGDQNTMKRILNQLFFPRSRMTPVLGLKRDNMVIENTYYIPFAYKNRGELKRDYLLNKRINILTIGKFYHRKNHLLLLKVCKELKKEFNIHLTIVGETSNATNELYLQQVIKYIAEENLSDIVTIKTNIPHAQISKEYIENDIFVLASTNELAAVSHLEAMGHGLLAISSNTNGTANYIVEGKTGYTFLDNSEEDLYKKLRVLCSNPDHIIRMGKEALQHVEENHSGKNIYDKFEYLFNDII